MALMDADEKDRLVNEEEKVVGHDGARKPPSQILVHLALITTQVVFGGGVVVGKFGVHGTNPVLFALIREGIAGPLLMAMALYVKVETPKRADAVRLLLAGVCIYLNQFCFIVGLKLSDPTTGSVWQPSQPIMTAVLAIALKYEKPDWRKGAGIVIAVGGAAFMVAYGSSSGGGGNPVVGNFLFFLNCLATSGYVILTKPLLKAGTYTSFSITGWSYISASCMMMVTAAVINNVQTLVNFVCQDEDHRDSQEDCENNPWRVPLSMVWCLAYWIIGNSVVSYALMTWGNRFAKASIVSAYTVLQPLTSAIICYIIVGIKGTEWADSYSLTKPGTKDLGIVAIVLGLVLVLRSQTMEEQVLQQYQEPSSDTELP